MADPQFDEDSCESMEQEEIQRLERVFDRQQVEVDRLRDIIAEALARSCGPYSDEELLRRVVKVLNPAAKSVRDAAMETRRCKNSEGSDGDAYAGCVLDTRHSGKCNLRARPDVVRQAAEQAGKGE